MARVTVEDCLARVSNRFALTILASRRARALSEGRGHAMVDCDNKEGVTALREISDDRVRFKEDVEQAMHSFIDEQRRQLRVTTGEHTFLEAASLRALEDDDIDLDEPKADVEELQTDPEALNKQAQGSAPKPTGEEDESDSDDETPPEAFEEGEAEAEATFSDDDAVEAEVADGGGDEPAAEEEKQDAVP